MRLVLVFLALATTLAAAPAASAPERAFALRGTVTYVVDGDTLDVRLAGGGQEWVRLIGIDTPERGACYASNATAAARRFASGRRVVLRSDATQDTRDRYGRLLAYVSVDGKNDLGYRLVRDGYAAVYVYARPFARLAAYRGAETSAKRLRRSLWTCGASTPQQGTSGGGRCDPSYPDFCIPPPPPDLDCADVPRKRFRVVGADPHRFDGDGDAIGCES
jgi:micrococcal nuclease